MPTASSSNVSNSEQLPRSDAGRIRELDALRGLAALSVLLRHYTWDYERLFGHDSQILFHHPLGNYGVELFFMLSGFVILLTLDRAKCVLDFAVSRFARLYPAYWAAVLISFVVVGICGLPGKEVGPEAALINLTTFQGILAYPDVDAVYWTLLCEMQFYILMGLIMVAGLRSHAELVLGTLVVYT